MGVAHSRRPAALRRVLIGTGVAAAALTGLTASGALNAGAADPAPAASHFHAMVMDPASTPSPAHAAPLAAAELPATGGSGAAAPTLGVLALASAYGLSRSGRARPARY